MSRVIDHAPAEPVVLGTIVPTQAVARRHRLPSKASATEQLWLSDGFAPPVPDLEDFLAEAPSAALSNTHRITLALFVAMLALASVLRVDIVVAGSGRLMADAQTIVLQGMQLAVIREIRVKPGDLVREGDVLATLDPTFTQADRAVLLSQQSAIGALRARLNAELGDTPLDVPAGSPGLPEWVLQQTLYRQRLTQFSDHIMDFTQKIEGVDKELAGAEQIRASLQQQVDLSREVEGMRNGLYRSQSGSKLVYLEAQAARMRNERDLQAALVHLNTLRQSRRAALSEQQAFVDSWRRELLEGLVKATADAAAVNEGLTKANRMNDLVVLTAPRNAVVLEVGKRSVGSVLNAAEPLITMVPSDAPLIAEISISSADIGYVKPGDPAEIKVEAFPYQRHGLLHGRLRSIAADSFAPTGGTPATATAFHHGQVELTGTALAGMPEGTRLIPGMTVITELKVGTRSVISYLLYPITRGFGESLREP